MKTTIGRLRVIGWLKGGSFLLLLGVAMPLEYSWGESAMVRVMGMAHGVLFLAYIRAAGQAAVEQGRKWRRTAAVMVASLLPAGPYVVDARLLCDVVAE